MGPEVERDDDDDRVDEDLRDFPSLQQNVAVSCSDQNRDDAPNASVRKPQGFRESLEMLRERGRGWCGHNVGHRGFELKADDRRTN